MAEILVIHPNLMAKGGGESVCMNVLEALQTDHAVDVLTVTHPDIGELNDYYATSVTDVGVRTAAGVARISERLPKSHFNRLRLSLLNRHVVTNELGSSYDLLFSTYNELRLDCDSVQYMHHPNFDRDRFPEMGHAYPASVYGVYDAFCDAVAHSPDGTAAATTYLANSDWTAEKVTEMLGTRPETVYPPVSVRDIRPTPWHEKENGIVTVGRLSPEKNVLRNIDVVARLRERGHDVEYHVLGGAGDAAVPFTESYGEKVESHAAQYDFVHLEGEVSRERLVEALSTQKYGLHGMDHEHFGIAVAELVAGGAIPFVPRGGGQVEIVDHCEDVLYDSVEEAVEKMDAVLSDETRQREVRARLPDVEERFGRDRFQREIRRITDAALS
ncbi:MAG: glycosyltransferase [Haloplanus sp.]